MSSKDGMSAEVLSSLAHALNTPISVIFGYAELIENRSEEAATREAAAHIKAAAERLRASVNQLLADAGA